MLGEIAQAIADTRRENDGLEAVTVGYPPNVGDREMAAAVVTVIRYNRDSIAKAIKSEVDWGTHGVITPDCVDISEAAADAVVALFKDTT